MTPIVVFVNLMSVIEVIPKDLTIVESFGCQLPTRPLVTLLRVQPFQMLQCPICCPHQHHLVGILYNHTMLDIPSYFTLNWVHIPNLLIFHVLKNLIYLHPLRPVTPLLN